MKVLISIIALFGFILAINSFAKGISTKELERLAEQYGGVYVFDKKLEKEIDEREALRKEMIKELKGRDLGDGLYAVDTSPVDKKFPQTLSNGKKYYTYTSQREYGEDYKKKLMIPKKYVNKIINFIGLENCKKKRPVLELVYFYVDNGNVIPISIAATYTYTQKQYGLFGDEGQGFSFSKDETIYASGGHSFYYNGETFIKQEN
ncbi:MAG: tRNA 2-selenouridine synthase [Campylobacter sp.]|nr:tRNA 2-selenouridine synthase [Campylobacter sp.]